MPKLCFPTDKALTILSIEKTRPYCEFQVPGRDVQCIAVDPCTSIGLLRHVWFGVVAQ